MPSQTMGRGEQHNKSPLGALFLFLLSFAGAATCFSFF
ncbi:hypothetical protein LINPERPRIM_LOCUS2158 [Linum perenne]